MSLFNFFLDQLSCSLGAFKHFALGFPRQDITNDVTFPNGIQEELSLVKCTTNGILMKKKTDVIYHFKKSSIRPVRRWDKEKDSTQDVSP